MIVRLLSSRVQGYQAQSYGQEITVGDEEGKRMVADGLAEFVVVEERETATVSPTRHATTQPRYSRRGR